MASRACALYSLLLPSYVYIAPELQVHDKLTVITSRSAAQNLSA